MRISSISHVSLQRMFCRCRSGRRLPFSLSALIECESLGIFIC